MAVLHNLLSKTLRPIKHLNAYKEALLIHDWQIVVGKEFAQSFLPINIQSTATGRTLRVQTSSSGMATIKYVEPLLLERVNRFFGAHYINNLKAVQGQINKPKAKASKNTNLTEPESLDAALQMIGSHLGTTKTS